MSRQYETILPHTRYVEGLRSRNPEWSSEFVNDFALTNYFDMLHHSFKYAQPPPLLLNKDMRDTYFDDNYDIFADKIRMNDLNNSQREKADAWWNACHVNLINGGKRKKTKKSRRTTKKSKRKTSNYKK
jgi:hypothetical protein